MSLRPTLALLSAGVVLLAGCSGDETPDPETESTAPAAAAAEPVEPTVIAPAAETSVIAGSGAAELAVATSAAMYGSAPVVILAPADDVAAQARAASLAVQLGVPMLLVGGVTTGSAPAATDSGTAASTSSAGESTGTGETAGPAQTAAPVDNSAVEAELSRLQATTVLDVGGVAPGLSLPPKVTVVSAPVSDEDLESVIGRPPGAPQSVPAELLVASVAALDATRPILLALANPPTDGSGTPAPAGDGSLPAIQRPSPAGDLLVLATADTAWLAATATARAAGARVQVVPGADPRANAATVEALTVQPRPTVLALGDVFGTPESLSYRVDVAATGVQLPGGGQVLFPGRRMVALYGNPTTSSLGVLGEQPLEESIERARRTAAEYDELWDEPVVPAFELITTVASAFAGPDNNYSTEMSIDELRPYIDAARDAGVYVVLDLQPGRTDFLTQAQRYEELLAEAHVGLALDPEWRLEPGEVHLVQIGHVDSTEVNSVVTWLADLTRERRLPQKLLILHQFRLDMIEGREQVDTSRDELAVLIHADGNGPPGSKYATYGALTASPPPNVWWGWKNFYDEDSPTFTPAETVAVDPSPVFVSYQ